MGTTAYTLCQSNTHEHNTQTLYFHLLLFSRNGKCVRVYWTANKRTGQRDDVAQTHTYLQWESRGGKRNVECHSLLYRKNNFIVSKLINEITRSLKTNTHFGNPVIMIV